MTQLFGKKSGNITIEQYNAVMSNPELKKIFDEYQLDFVFKINKLIIETYYENNVELEKIEYFFEEKEY